LIEVQLSFFSNLKDDINFIWIYPSYMRPT